MESSLRIETIVGFNGNQQGVLAFQPQRESAVLYAVGGIVVREDLS